MHPKRNTNLENASPQITCREKKAKHEHIGPNAMWINSSARGKSQQERALVKWLESGVVSQHTGDISSVVFLHR